MAKANANHEIDGSGALVLSGFIEPHSPLAAAVATQLDDGLGMVSPAEAERWRKTLGDPRTLDGRGATGLDPFAGARQQCSTTRRIVSSRVTQWRKRGDKPVMRTLIVSEFISLDGVMQAPGGADEDRDGGFAPGGWTVPYWHDDIGRRFYAHMQNADALLLGRRTYETHAAAFEPMPPGDPIGDMLNTRHKYVVSRTLEKPLWRDTTIIRDDVVNAIRELKSQPGKSIVTDGSSQLVQTMMVHDLVDEPDLN